MPSRRKPTSTKQKKADQQLRRAIKRGDVPPPDPKSKTHHRRPKTIKVGPTGQQTSSSADNNAASVELARRLQSAFIKLPSTYLEHTKTLASLSALSRPIPNASAIFDIPSHHGSENALTCPKRPKWRFDMTKNEVERNEEGLFKKWLAQTDELVLNWQNRDSPFAHNIAETHFSTEHFSVPSSPTYFERNIEVWRQLWRVTEISQIILVLLDSRCPILHYPPSLSAYLSERKVILVLTKVDITGPIRVQAWTDYLHKIQPHVRIVQVESYVEKEESTSHQGRRQYEPHIPASFRRKLVETLKEVHAEMIEPPERVKNNPMWLKKWVSPVRREVDWEGVLNASGSNVGKTVGGASLPRERAGDDIEGDKDPEFLTLGLIGQPNVGKSSLLNALFGARRVRASKTPGKTKHFQTLYWTSDVRLVDCPGLVMPNYVPMELQVLAGILPISRVSAVPSCIYFISRIIPLEQIYKLTHPSIGALEVEDKRTWRNGTKSADEAEKKKVVTWTAMDILTAYADVKGWVTAKAGRPDIHRAGNAILRALAEARVAWAFWPPGYDIKPEESEISHGGGTGIWIPGDGTMESDDDEEQESEPEDDETGLRLEGESKSGSSEQEETDNSEDSLEVDTGVGRFGALMIQNEGDVSESEEA